MLDARATFGVLSLALGAAFGQLGGLVVTADSWPWFLALGILPATAQLLLQPMLLESPRWCAMSGEDRMAEAMLVQLRGRSSPTEELQEELAAALEVEVWERRRMEGEAAALRSFLDAHESLYFTPSMRDEREAAARANLAAEIGRLQSW